MKKKTLMHYTTLDATIEIVKSKKFKISLLKDMNDLQEAKLETIYPKLKVFKSCSFSKTNKENIPMWKIYGKKDENATAAVIKFIFKKNCDYNELFHDERIVGQQVDYIKVNQFNRYSRGKNDLGSMVNEGFIKAASWAFEQEYRFGSFEYLNEEYFQLNFDCIEKIEISVFPINGSNEKVENIKKKKLKSIIDQPYYSKISFKTSFLAKQIK